MNSHEFRANQSKFLRFLSANGEHFIIKKNKLLNIKCVSYNDSAAMTHTDTRTQTRDRPLLLLLLFPAHARLHVLIRVLSW